MQDEWSLPVWLQGSAIQQALLGRLPPPSKLFEAITGDQGQLVLPALLGITQSITVVVSGVFIILFLSIYWSINQIHFERLWLSLLPSGQRKQARGIWRTVEPDTGAYIRSQVIHSLLAGLLLGLGYWLIGSPYPALLALIGALACLIPVVGPALALISVLIGWAADQCAAWHHHSSLYAWHFDCPGSMGQATAFQSQMEQSHSDRSPDDCHGRRFWPDRPHHSTAFIGCLPDPVEPPGQPPRRCWGCSPGLRPQRAAGTIAGGHKDNGWTAPGIGDQQHGAAHPPD